MAVPPTRGTSQARGGEGCPAAHESARLLEELGGRVFIPLFLKPTRQEFRRYDENPIDALKLFLRYYAFERPGKSPRYSLLAVKSLDELSRSGCSPFDCAAFSRNLWEKFLKLGEFPDNGKGANRKVNPLYPGCGKETTRDLDAVAFCRGLKPYGYNLYCFALDHVRQDKLLVAYAGLRRIRGVGAKIASLFLQDVALDNTLTDTDLRHRELLQRIDVWVRRSAQRLLGRNAIKQDGEAAQELVGLADAAGCRALRLNACCWYLGSQIARTKQRLDGALESPVALRKLTREYGVRLGNEAALLDTLLGTSESRGSRAKSQPLIEVASTALAGEAGGGQRC